MSDHSDERVPVPLDTALERLEVIPDYDPGGGEGPGPCVHTFRPAGLRLLGAHCRLAQVRAAIERYGVEESGPEATRMGHALVLFDQKGPVFLAARSAAGGSPIPSPPHRR